MAPDQIITTNGQQSFVIGRAAAVAAASTTEIINLDSPSGVVGINIGLGLSDVSAWADCSFDITLNGRVVLSIKDQLSSLLQTLFIPIKIRRAENIKIVYSNGATAPVVDVAVTLRVES